MTYQNLGYWIGQANDSSTGRHPTGWTSGQRWSETAGEWTVMYDSSQSALTSMTTDRNYWKTTVAHDDPNVYTNRYNDGYAQATTDKQPPASATQTNVTGPSVTWGAAGETTILSYTIPKAGYYWMAGVVTVWSGVGDQVTFRLRAAGTLISAMGIWNVEYYATPLMTGTAPVLMSAGQAVTLTGQSASQPANNIAAQTMLSVGFVPTQAYPH